MSDEPLSWAAKFAASLASKNGRRGAQIHAYCAGAVLFGLHTISIIDPGLAGAVSPYFHVAVYYAIGSLVAMASLVVRQPFITPEVRHPECNFCGGPMSTTGLKCESCQSRSNKGD